MESSIYIGNYTITLVHPDMVRIYDEDAARAVTVKVDDFEAVMDQALEDWM